MDISLDKLDFFGKSYVIDHCVAFFKRKNERRLYESYVADALKAIAENTAKTVKDGIGLSKRYAELLQEYDSQTKEETPHKKERTAAEIINHIKDKLNKLGG